MNKQVTLGLIFGLIGLSSTSAVFADDAKSAVCPVESFNGLSLDDEFGAGASELTKCLSKRNKAKVVMQINSNACAKKDATEACLATYGFRNIGSMIRDYTVTNGIDADDVDFAVIVHSKGGKTLMKGHPLAANVAAVMDMGVKVYLCQNTARSMMNNIEAETGVRPANFTNMLVPGVQYVTGGLTALADFQSKGYRYIQP